MDGRGFDALARAIAGDGSTRRGLLRLLAALPVAGIVGPPPESGAARKANKSAARRKRKARRKDRGGSAPAARQRASCCAAADCAPGAGKNLAACCYPGADLSGQTFARANLRNANLRGATAAGASFAQANLEGACLVDANLSGGVLRNANLRGAVLCRTTMPDGSRNDSGCERGSACCPVCDDAHPCPEGSHCCAGRCRRGDCCAAADCPPAPACHESVCANNRCRQTPVADGAGPECATHCCDGICCPEGITDCDAQGNCGCTPNCDGKRCGDGDGCGGMCTDCGPCADCTAQGTCAPKPNGTICGTRNGETDYLRCCNGQCPAPTCLAGGEVCDAPGSPTCNACCNGCANKTRPIIGYATGECSTCPTVEQLVANPTLTCPPCPTPGTCRPCLGLHVCTRESAGDQCSLCGSDADCERGTCVCGRCCAASGERLDPSTCRDFPERCCSYVCNGEICA